MSVLTLETADERIHDHARVPAFSPTRLRVARERRGLTVGQLAAAAGRDVRTVRRYQAGEVVPPTTVLCAFAAVLLVPIGDLFE